MMPTKEYSSGTKRPHSSRKDEDNPNNVKKRRSRSPHRHGHKQPPKASLPFRSQHLHKHDFVSHRALFAHYLDLQKQLYIENLSEDEVKGRWKSFLGKWNRGELAEGWYDPTTKTKADERAAQPDATPSAPRKDDRGFSRPTYPPDDLDADDDYGPALPQMDKAKRGPTAPNLQDLQHRRELNDEDALSARKELRLERKADRSLQKERLEELAPRADPGSRERQLEKKHDAAASNKAFADAREGGAEDVGESDLMGDDGVEGFKARRKMVERQKNERELRKEEILRARAVEREERLMLHRAKEDKTMVMLKELAQQRFGGQG